MSGFNGAVEGGVLHGYDVVNNLTSTNTDKPLSANMGKTLNEAIAQSTAKLKRITVTGVNSTNFMVTGFMAANGITPSKVLGVYINSDSGFSQQPISVFYNNIAADNLYIRTATAPTSGTLNITVMYLD